MCIKCQNRKNEVKRAGPGDLLSKSKREAYGNEHINDVNSNILRRKRRFGIYCIQKFCKLSNFEPL